jgi:hypothetical protein
MRSKLLIVEIFVTDEALERLPCVTIRPETGASIAGLYCTSAVVTESRSATLLLFTVDCS